MNNELLTLALAAGAIVVLILLITRLKLNPFLALTLAAIGLGLVAGVGANDTIEQFAKGFGGALAKTGPVIGLGTLLGGILLGSGGADRIANAFIGKRPVQYAPYAVCAAALLIGMPHLFDVSFIMLAPLVYTVAKRTHSHLLYIGLPLAAGLYTSHGLLPPHPAPMLAVAAFHANTGLTIFYGLLIAIPTAILSGPVFTQLVAPWFGPAPDLSAGPVGAREEGGNAGEVGLLPAIVSVLLPPGLMLIGTLGMAYSAKGTLAYGAFGALNNPILSLLAAVIFAFFALGLRSGFNLGQVGKMANKGLAPLGAILLILGAGGGFKQMLSAVDLDQVITHHASGWPVNPLILAWGIAALLRICVGSATVATVAATGIVAPLALAHPALSPELLVLATASGAVMLSHVNDSGFWLFKEYFQLSVAQTFRTWTLMLCVQSVLGLAGVLLIEAVIG
ncbi:gluconate:H+ symporter [Pseudomonas typographi]|uniref:Permease DsdX n=1 Tax=Pseudomonas typographi TaxID=2715964 RepID=A0ABR7Z6W7_9PSED|nr:gluconate:H+ symporter [Pseudomonas typographi]MBD1589252.1 permease DsdX [Pseudomonas typographi]MBD1601280.1 permease DsdX [Pseudomonas typographi]